MKISINRIVSYLIIVIMFNLLIVAGIATNVSADKIDENKLYILKWSKVSKLISRIDYRDFIDSYLTRRYWDMTSRNVDGTSIRVINRNNKKAIVFNCDGSYKQIELPSYNSWLDNNNNILAWPDDGDKKLMKYLKGHSPADYGAIEPGGQYFISRFDKNYFAIVSASKPDTPLVRVNIISNDHIRIFYKNDKIYVFGHTVRDPSIPVKGFIYEKDGATFRLAEEFEIPREKKAESPYVIEDMSPWSDEISMIDVYDFPSFSKRYIFNIKTKELKYYGLATKEKGLFLQCDVLKRVEENLKNK